MKDIEKVEKIKAFLGGIEKLTQGIDTDKLKKDGGLGIKDATMVDILRSILSEFKSRNVI